MYVRPISTRLLRGMLTPAIRAKVCLPLSLLVSRVRADHQHAPVAADDLALLAHRLHRRSYLHVPFRLKILTEWLWRPCGRRYHPPERKRSVRAQRPSRPRARPSMVAKRSVASTAAQSRTQTGAQPLGPGAGRHASRVYA